MMGKSLILISSSFLFLMCYLIIGKLLMSLIPDLWGNVAWDISGIVLGKLYLCYVFKHDTKSDKRVKLFSNETVGYFLWIIAIFLVGQTLAFSILQNFGDTNYNVYHTILRTNADLYLVIALILAPIMEEIVFRGVLYKSLRDCVYHPLIAASLVSFVFAIIHGTVVHLFVGFALSMLNILVYEKTRNLRYCIICHMCHNFLATCFVKFIPVMGFMYNIYLMLSLGILIIVGLYWQLNKTYQATISP